VTAGRYRLWAAISHEIARLLCNERPSLGHNQLLKALLAHTCGDWIEWRTETTLRDVDSQIAALHQSWDAQLPTPVITESTSGELRIRAPWLPPLPLTESNEHPDTNPPD
jgi:hypothetical protein